MSEEQKISILSLGEQPQYERGDLVQTQPSHLQIQLMWDKPSKSGHTAELFWGKVVGEIKPKGSITIKVDNDLDCVDVHGYDRGSEISVSTRHVVEVFFA